MLISSDETSSGGSAYQSRHSCTCSSCNCRRSATDVWDHKQSTSCSQFRRYSLALCSAAPQLNSTQPSSPVTDASV